MYQIQPPHLVPGQNLLLVLKSPMIIVSPIIIIIMVI